jgi:hypothetical protein
MIYSSDILRKLEVGKTRPPVDRPPGQSSIELVLSTLETLQKHIAETQAKAQALLVVAAAQLAVLTTGHTRTTKKQDARIRSLLSLLEGHEAIAQSLRPKTSQPHDLVSTTKNGALIPFPKTGKSKQAIGKSLSANKGKS